ncbi:alpha/beta hydrolase [Brevibacillus ginsengisoli]|uniref:alpha/beta hydrolase n=1 Tax=Brevibacillus ginsengisoli TaxID=363854 RepID=UPI003CF01C8F
MSRVTFSNTRAKTLVGTLYSASSKSIIIMAHGFTSDRLSKGRFPRLAEAFNRSGFDALAFDFSGCGESDDDSLTTKKWVDDLRAAIRFAQSLGYQQIGLYGHSLGSLICLTCYSPEIATIVVSGALTAAMYYKWEEQFNQEQLRELQETGMITVIRTEGMRRQIKIDQQMLLDFELVNQKELLQRVTCPVLIIHGNNDEEERLLCERSNRGMRFLSSESQLVVIDGANHSFLDQFGQVIELVNSWFVTYLPQ